MEFEIFWEKMTSFVDWGAIKVLFFDFIQKMSQALSSSIWEDKLDYLNNPSQDLKNSFCLWFLQIFSNAGCKIREAPFSKVQSGKITMWEGYKDRYI